MLTQQVRERCLRNAALKRLRLPTGVAEFQRFTVERMAEIQWLL